MDAEPHAVPSRKAPPRARPRPAVGLVARATAAPTATPARAARRRAGLPVRAAAPPRPGLDGVLFSLLFW